MGLPVPQEFLVHSYIETNIFFLQKQNINYNKKKRKKLIYFDIFKVPCYQFIAREFPSMAL